MGKVREATRSILKVDWPKFDGLGALRCTLGVAVPLLAGIALDQPLVAVFGAAGAVGVGFGSFQSAYRSRAGLMLLAAVAMAFSVFAGSLAAHSYVATVAVAALWAFVGGLLVALGEGASFVGLQSIVAALIAGGYPSDVEGGAARAALVFGGGLVQTFLVAVIWPLRRFAVERRRLAAAYRSLSTYASTIPTRPGLPPEPHTFAGTPAAFADPQPFAESGEAFVFQSLLDEAERIRASLAALSIHYPKLEETNQADASALADLSAQALAEIAASLEAAREPREPFGFSETFATRIDELSSRKPFEFLVMQIRAAWRTAGVLNAVPGHLPSRREHIARPRPAVRDALITLRANLTTRSTAFRHALRLTAILTLALAAARALELPRGYWLPLTIALVLKPDFRDTFAFSIGRVAGTVLGAAVTGVIVVLLAPPPVVVIVLVLAFVWGAYAFRIANYTAASACITGYVVFLMTLAGIPEVTAATDRIFYTLIAGVLALCAYAVWPTWTATEVRPALATMLAAQGAYVASLLGAYATARKPDLKQLDGIRADTRLARSNAEALVERMLAEPRSRDTMTARAAVGIVGAARRNALAALSLHAGLDRDDHLVVPAIAELASQIATSLDELATSLREWPARPRISLLDHAQSALATIPRGVVRDEIELIVDSIDTIAELLARATVDKVQPAKR